MPSILNTRSMLVAGFCAAGSMPLGAIAEPEPTFPAEQIRFFERNVRPVLAEACHECHGPKRQKNGLRLDSRDAVLRGSDFNKVVIPGNPDASLLIKALRHAPGVEAMPAKKEALDRGKIDALAEWIRMGLPWPREAVAGEPRPKWQEHWAFQAVKKPPLPVLPGSKVGAANPIDAFVSAKLRAVGLDFAPEADPATLGRRLHLGLTGLPPTYEQLRSFVDDRSPEAVARLVARLLDSPRYGERWARHWLDVARYSDTEGYRAGGVDIRFPHAFTYRDWVIAALNEDMPYDRFITLQLAADKVPGVADSGAGARHLAALGFLTVNDHFLGDRTLQIDDRIDVITQGVLGVTVGCARCHDHKYDPVTTKDYYGLYSVFNSCDQPDQLPVIGAPSDRSAAERFERKVGEVEARIRDFRLEVLGDLRRADRLAAYLAFAHQHRDTQGGAFSGAAGKANLRDRLAARWREFLKRHASPAKPHPVMLAWSEFAKVPADQLPARAAEIARRLTLPESGGNGAVRRELAKRPPPKSMADLAALYAEVFLAGFGKAAPDNDDWRQVRALVADAASPMSASTDNVDAFFTRKDREHMTKFENDIKKLELDEPGAPLRAMVLRDSPQPRDVRVFIRGNPARQGEPAPRAYPAFLGGQRFTSGSGRLELAAAITGRDNPLTARVIVNRVWMGHFGKPLVSQPSDFGVQTPRPPHADLLDYLAAVFMENGWSLKKLHHLIVTSRTYRQSCASTPEKDLKDADNVLLSRFNRTRLDYESMRDSLLFAAGSLDVSRAGGRSTPLQAPEAETRRSVYLFVDRYEQPTVPAMFDFANPDRHSPQRFATLVPQQALFLMNSPFVRTLSDRLASALPASEETSALVTALYRRVLLREPQPGETAAALRFLAEARNLQTPAFVWRYGAAQILKDEETGSAGLLGFSEFKHFEKRGAGHRWMPGPRIPDPKWHHCFWGSHDGHAGSGDTAAAAQWTAPFDGLIRITGTLSRPNAAGNGVRGWILHTRAGLVAEAVAPPKGAAQMTAGPVAVARGDVLTFAVTSDGDSNSDSFSWVPVIHRIHADGRTELLTDARRDFCGPDHWPLKRARPQSALSQLAQVLLMSNEFQFAE